MFGLSVLGNLVGAAAISSGHLSLPIIGRIFRGASSEENFTKGTRTNQHEHSPAAAVEIGNYKMEMELMNTLDNLQANIQCRYLISSLLSVRAFSSQGAEVGSVTALLPAEVMTRLETFQQEYELSPQELEQVVAGVLADSYTPVL